MTRTLALKPTDVYEVANYDSGNPSARAINDAIADCFAHGGGTVRLDGVSYSLSRPVMMRPGVVLKGTHRPRAAGINSSYIYIPYGMAGIQLTNGTDYNANCSVEGVIIDGATGGAGGIGIDSVNGCISVILRDITILNCQVAGFRLAGQCENVYADTIGLGSNTIGIKHTERGWGDAQGYPSLQKSHFRDLFISAGTYGVYSDASSSNVLWENIRAEFMAGSAFTLIGQYVDSVFVNMLIENAPQGGLVNDTTGAVTSGTTSLVVASAAGFAPAQTITIQGAAVQGLDLTTTIVSIAGTTFTLAAAAGATVSGVEVTNRSGASISLQATQQQPDHGSPSRLTFINCGMGTGSNLYAIDARSSQITLLGSCDTYNRPIYDPNYWVSTLLDSAATAYIRRPSGYSGDNQSYTASVAAALSSARAVAVAPPGGDYVIGLTGGTPLHDAYVPANPAGKFQVRRGDSGRTLLFEVDGQTGAVSGITVPPFGQVVTVAKSGGQFTDIQTAIDSITDASATKPYTVLVYPGVYTLGAGAYDYISLTGSWRKTASPGFDGSHAALDYISLVGVDRYSCQIRRDGPGGTALGQPSSMIDCGQHNRIANLTLSHLQGTIERLIHWDTGVTYSSLEVESCDLIGGGGGNGIGCGQEGGSVLSVTNCRFGVATAGGTLQAASLATHNGAAAADTSVVIFANNTFIPGQGGQVCCGIDMTPGVGDIWAHINGNSSFDRDLQGASQYRVDLSDSMTGNLRVFCDDLSGAELYNSNAVTKFYNYFWFPQGKFYIASGAVTKDDCVVFDPANGKFKTIATANTSWPAVTLNTQTDGAGVRLATGRRAEVKVLTAQAVALGDTLVTSATAGSATVNNAQTDATKILGWAETTKAAAAAGIVTVRLNGMLRW